MEPRYSKDGRLITEEWSNAIRGNLSSFQKRRNAYSSGEIPLPEDGIRRSRDGRIVTEKWLESNRRTSAKLKGKKRVLVPSRRKGTGVEFPSDFLDRIDAFAGRMRRAKLMVRVITDRIAKEEAGEETMVIPDMISVPGGRKVKVVQMPNDFLAKLNAHVGDKHVRVRYIVRIMDEYMRKNGGTAKQP